MSMTPPLTREHTPGRRSAPRTRKALRFAELAVSEWNKIQNMKIAVCMLDGNNLDIGAVVAVAKHGGLASILSDPQIDREIQASIDTLHKELRNGHLVYGVNTGFGGSADTRTTDTERLQRALIQHQNSGVLTCKDLGGKRESFMNYWSSNHVEIDANFDTQSMPTAWVRASMLIRCNSIIRGHSAVRKVVAESILTLLRHEITPVVPLRGSISASGDLSPLSYIAGAIEGSPDIFVRVGFEENSVMTAQEALNRLKIEPIVLRAKEGLGLLNGTAFSTATATIALHYTIEIAMMSQILTAMATEALGGTAESFFPQIAKMRPHPGQMEAAANILAYLRDSKLAACVEGPKNTNTIGLYQDRYALRTSSQWIGPQLEDLSHAREQLLTELNSTTDNPVVDVESDHILHGGNFQAAIVTSTMDRARIAIERLGRMLFAQSTEMINPLLNNGLPPNLSSDDPSLSFTCKGIDINMASYASELGFLANPVGNHVMSAEMHNQSINSLALISSRYTFQAIDTIRMMCAAYLFVVCQALDLRVQEVMFQDKMRYKLVDLVIESFYGVDNLVGLTESIIQKFESSWPATPTLDLQDRAAKTTEFLIPVTISHLTSNPPTNTTSSSTTTLQSIQKFTTKTTTLLINTFTRTKTTLQISRLDIVPSYFGNASKQMYRFIRSPDYGLGIPFHQGLIEHPSMPRPEGWSQERADARKTIGSQVSVIYEALRDGAVRDCMMEIVAQSLK